MRCTVFGTGYLGATHAAGMAELGHDVVGIDIDPGKVAKLAAGDIPFYEPGLRKLLSDNLAAGRLRSHPTGSTSKSPGIRSSCVRVTRCATL